jgi:hypothetical protein
MKRRKRELLVELIGAKCLQTLEVALRPADGCCPLCPHRRTEREHELRSENGEA